MIFFNRRLLLSLASGRMDSKRKQRISLLYAQVGNNLMCWLRQELAQNRSNGGHTRFLAFRTARAMFGSSASAHFALETPCHDLTSESVTPPNSGACDEVLVDCNIDNTLESGEPTSKVLKLLPTGQLGQTESRTLKITSAATTSQPEVICQPSSYPMDIVALEPAGGCQCEIDDQTDLSSVAALAWSKEVTAVWTEPSITAGMKENTELSRAVLQVYQQSTLIPGGHLDLEASYAERALRQSDSGSSFHTR